MRLSRSSANHKRELRVRKLELARTLAQNRRLNQPKVGPINNDSVPIWRSRLLVTIFAIGFVFMLGRAYYLATSPDIKMKAQMLAANLPLDALSALVYQSDRLSALSQDIDSVSVSTLRSAISDTAKAANSAAKEFRSRSQAWSELRGKIKNDQSTYDSLRSELEQVQKLQRGELIKLKKMLDEAQKPSIFADTINLTISFLLGVVGSILATWLYESWKGKKWRWLDYF